MDTQTLSMAFLAATAIGGAAWVFLYPILSGERKAEQRQSSIIQADPLERLANKGRPTGKSRREQVEDTLKDIDIKNRKSKQVPLAARISQAGLTWSKQRFIMISVAIGFAAFLAVLVLHAGIFAAVAAGFAGAFGVPKWLLSYLKARREKRFLQVLPDAVDVIVRGIKAGLPLLDSLKIIAAEAQEPAKSEFRNIIDTQMIGIPLGDACIKLYERMPLPEANFFGIVVSIQQKSGGNLSEALGNLSRVLRDRKKMDAKIKAMSQEAKASAGIIGSLPIVVMGLVYLTSPAYIEMLWTERLGQIMLACCLVWMLAGIMVMRKMINFDF